MYELNINHMDDRDEAIPMRDTEGDIFKMHVHVDKSLDLSHMANVNVPVLFGGEWSSEQQAHRLHQGDIELDADGLATFDAEIDVE